MRTRFHFNTLPIVAQKLRELKKTEGKTVARILEDIVRDRVPDMNKFIDPYTEKLVMDIDEEILNNIQELAKTHRTSPSHVINCMIIN